jgi:hydrogenase nickel incorporation protein HypB
MCEEFGKPSKTQRTHQRGDHTHKSIPVAQNIIDKNDAYAQRNRALFKEKELYAVNIISSPGSGKTAVIEALARHFGVGMAVVEGDIQTRRDSERVIRAGSRAYQIETGGACHLSSRAVTHALEHLELSDIKLLVIENVGNLVCPSTYNLGENEKIAILSLPEGDDKILKYPALFSRIQALVINKIDLRPYLDFDTDKAVSECRSLNRSFSTFEVSAKTGEGIERLVDYLEKRISEAIHA